MKQRPMKRRPMKQAIPRAVGLAVQVLAILSLTGCLEVEQHPRWLHGTYNGKPDNLPQQVHFGHDRLAWNAVLANRTHLQNEYGRMDRP